MQFVCDTLHVLISEAVYPFVGKSQRAKIEPEECVRGRRQQARSPGAIYTS